MVNCTVAPPVAPSDAGIAGTGILLSFMITAVLALALSASVVATEVRGRPVAATTIRRKLLNGLSDSQIVQGIGIQSVALARVRVIVPYHFFLVWMLSLLSMATHNAALLALASDYRRYWVLRWLRQLLMLANLILSCVSGIFVLQIVSRGMTVSTLPVSCVWDGAVEFANPSSTSDALSYIGTIVVIAGNAATFVLATWYLHSRARRWYKTLQVVGLLVMTTVAVGAAVRVVLLSSAFGKPSVTLADENEKDWSFGQSLSMLMLVMPLISAIEIYGGDVQVAAVEGDGRPLFDSELQVRPRHQFQPNPSYGSETTLVKK